MKTNGSQKRHDADADVNPEATSFGRQTVTPEEKTSRVLGVFDSVASRYDVMNDFMSGGMHRIWKDKLINRINPAAGERVLDVAGGTGDIAFRIFDATQGKAPITVCDINESMLAVGRDRALDRGIASGIAWVAGSAECLPFADDSFDVYTISFGLRNVTHIDTALAEAARVLKKGGRFYCLEFSHVDNPLVKRMYDEYSDKVIPRLGSIVAGDRDSYAYLVESIRKFPRREALGQRLLKAGFSSVRYETMTFGVVAVHEAIR